MMANLTRRWILTGAAAASAAVIPFLAPAAPPPRRYLGLGEGDHRDSPARRLQNRVGRTPRPPHRHDRGDDEIRLGALQVKLNPNASGKKTDEAAN
jgi:hypothetical protein